MERALQTTGITTIVHSPEPEWKIFIVDDGESSLAALGYRLMKENRFHNYKIYCFESGEEFVKHLPLRPNLIIMDQYLACTENGGLCGSALIRKIRKIDPDVPVVIISGKQKAFQLPEADQDDSYYYLVKDRAAHESVNKILRMIQSPVVH